MWAAACRIRCASREAWQRNNIDIAETIAAGDPNAAVFVGDTLDAQIRLYGGLPDRSGDDPEIYVGAKRPPARS